MNNFKNLFIENLSINNKKISNYRKLLINEISKRSNIKFLNKKNKNTLRVCLIIDKEVGNTFIKDISEFTSLKNPGIEGFRIYSNNSLLIISGHDELGILYGIGYFLRKIEIRNEFIRIINNFNTSRTPKSSLRGHQLGYRPKTNAYDMWDKTRYKQYIIDLSLFGANSIEILPPRTDDEPKTKEMLYDQLEMMIWLSEQIKELGLNVWIWYPNISEDFSVPSTIEFESKERELIFSKLPYIDAVLIPGGDPGDQEPEVLFKWAEIQQNLLTKYHPNAELWISGQIFDATPSWQGQFFKELGKEPKWLSGVCHGPWVKGDEKEFRLNVPEKYKIRRYPDITHSLSCQYPVRDWDPAWGSTHGRECYNPRPNDFKVIHNKYCNYADGSLSYSEGINDDINKYIWSDQDWDPEINVDETLSDFVRLFISPDYVDEIKEGILNFEKSWNGPIQSNHVVDFNFVIWQNIEYELSHLINSNYRLVQALFRAYYDSYVKSRYINEKFYENKIFDLMKTINENNYQSNLKNIKQIIKSCINDNSLLDLKEKIVELADKAFELIKWQTSINRHKGQAVVRGAYLDAIDFQITDIPYIEKELLGLKMNNYNVVKKKIFEILNKCKPKSNLKIINFNEINIEEIQKETSWENDPSNLTLPYIVNIPAPFPNYHKVNEVVEYDQQNISPIIEKSYIASFYCNSIKIKLKNINPMFNYILKACHVDRRGEERKNNLRLLANGYFIHGYELTSKNTIVESIINRNYIKNNGDLILDWKAKPHRVYSEGIAWCTLEVIKK